MPSGGSSRRLFDNFYGELSGVIASDWGEDVQVTLDDKLHMSEQTTVQTVAGPVNFATTNSHTFAGPVNFSSTIITPNSNNLASLDTDEVSQLLNIGAASITTGEWSQIANIGAAAISGTEWGYVAAMDQSVAQAATVTFAGATFAGIVNFGNTVYFNGTTYYVDSSGNAYFGATVTCNKITGPSGNGTYFDFDNLELKTLDASVAKVTPFSYNYAEISMGSGSITINSGDTVGDEKFYMVSGPTSGDLQIRPASYEVGYIGMDAKPWLAVYAKEVLDDDGNLGSYAHHDDLGLIRGLMPWVRDGKIQKDADGTPIIDYNTIPDFLKGYKHKTKMVKKIRNTRGKNGIIVEEEFEMEQLTDEVIKRKYVRPSNLAMFAIGAIKQLDLREEEHFDQLLEVITSIQQDIQALRGSLP